MRRHWKKSPELKRGRSLFFVLLVVFLFLGLIGLLSWRQSSADTEKADSTISIEGQPAATSNTVGTEPETSTSESDVENESAVDTEEIKRVTEHFVVNYYAYDQTNTFKNLADVRSDTDPGFFKELSDAQTNNTHPKQIGYREVTDFEIKSIEPDGEMVKVQVATVFRLFDKQKQKIQDVDTGVLVQLKKEQAGYKVFYVTAQSSP